MASPAPHPLPARDGNGKLLPERLGRARTPPLSAACGCGVSLAGNDALIFAMRMKAALLLTFCCICEIAMLTIRIRTVPLFSMAGGTAKTDQGLFRN